ncbi:DEAD/DEAH box helicase [Nocardia africana]|uniref:DEAD/DEAH box helicase n=1 Tax=Nocardia africana TaxID=134964 RepID=A0ABW6NU64_9NOCA
MSYTTLEVWAQPRSVAGNHVRQLLVPAGALKASTDGDKVWVANNFGRWPVVASKPSGEVGALTAEVPNAATDTAVVWHGDRDMMSPQRVQQSYKGAITFDSPPAPNTLRRPQLGALHSVLGYWQSGLTSPSIVVMPTGTGKTETMLAVLIAAQVERLLVVVPTAALRAQVASKFESLGVLQSSGIVSPAALRPVVGKLERRLTDPADASEIASLCNVIVATPQVLGACSPEALEAFYAQFSHLMVDEAHHSAARTWSEIITRFSTRPVVLFTATPFREDGKQLPGRTIFRFPLREAQAQDYFTHIDYEAVLSLTDTDSTLADKAIARLEADLAAGYDHILMARAKSKDRATTLLDLYTSKAPAHHPRLIHSGMGMKAKKEVLEALAGGTSRVVVCVDMLGEGFDLPELKIAALHDPKQSLGPMIQLVGRFTRTSTTRSIGTASVFVPRDPSVAWSPLRELLKEDADWNLMLRDITERVTEESERHSEFERTFSDVPEEVPIGLLEPKMSAVAYRTPDTEWWPEQALEHYGRERILGSTVATSADRSVAWFVLELNPKVRWGDVPTLPQVSYELIVTYFDSARRLLYINASELNGTYKELAMAIAGPDCEPIRGLSTFRVLADLDRLVPTNVGLLDSRDHFNRFSMHVGSDVVVGLERAEQQGKTQTHIAASGFDNGDRVTICAALSGRFWSLRAANSIKAWTTWCDHQGDKLINDSINLERLMDGFIRPIDVTSRDAVPFVLLGLEWPWDVIGGLTSSVRVTYLDRTYDLLDINFEVDEFDTVGPYKFSLATPAWRLPYQAEFVKDVGLTYAPRGTDDATISSRRDPIALATWINQNKPTLLLEGDRIITAQDRLLAARNDLEPFDRARLHPLRWSGVDLSVESQGPGRRADSIQAFMSKYVQTKHTFDVLIDDDRALEAADLVGLRVKASELHISLIHCKYSTEHSAGARVKDLYEVCGQAMRGGKWRRDGAKALFRHLERRIQRYVELHTVSPFDVGTLEDLYRIHEVIPQLKPRFHTIIAQPGLSAAAAGDDHLRLIAGADSYLWAVTRGTFDFYCSP